jgi:hypothetical protein
MGGGCMYTCLYNRFLSFLICTQPVGLLGQGGSARRKAATSTQNNINKINAHRHPGLKWNSKSRSQCSSGEDRWFLGPNGHCDRRSGYIDPPIHYLGIRGDWSASRPGRFIPWGKRPRCPLSIKKVHAINSVIFRWNMLQAGRSRVQVPMRWIL